MKNKQILIVENEHITAMDVKKSLARFGYGVSGIASSGKESIKKAEENRPDIVLMDIGLEGEMDGIEAASVIRTRFDIPVVYLTAYADESTIDRAKTTEPFGFILKPINDNDLYSTIERVYYKHTMEKKLKESEAFNFSLFQYNPIETMVVDREGRVVKSNLARRKSRDRLPDIGDVMFKDYVSKHEPDMHAELMECIRSGKIKEFPEYKYGDQFLNITIAPFPEGAIITSQDITDRKRMEEEKNSLQAQLVHSEKMAGIGTLASGIAHEFNNMLQIIQGHSEFAQRTKKTGDMEEALDIVLNTSDKCVKIVRDLLTFSRQEELEKELCDITDLVESSLSLIEEQLKKHNIEVVREGYGSIPSIKVNKAEMQQVFLNLIMNARDAMLPKGGKLNIRINKVKKNVEVSFSDTGQGIEEENLGKVFEPFYTTKGAAGGSLCVTGTGLGLSIAYGIIQRHGGTIEVESDVGKGTTFTIKFSAKG
jgi:signal transduction histidine kinase/DNA-binding NarL/FixJ family response regulator